MNTAHLSLATARRLATSLRASRNAGRSWNQNIDRDLTRQSHELYLLAQSTAPRVL